MKHNTKTILVIFFIIISSLSGKSFATDFSYTAATGSFSVLTTNYVGGISNAYYIQTSVNSTLMLMYSADMDPYDHFMVYGYDINNVLITTPIKIITDGSGVVTTTIPNGRALVIFWTDATGHYSDMGYRGISVQYSTTSSIAQGQIYNYQGNTVLTGKVGIGMYTPGYALDVNGSTNVSNDLFASGKIGIGTQTPATSLNIVGTTDVSPTTPGLFVIGATSTINIGIDQNEIMARTNNVASTLYLNHEGGNIVFNGTNTAGGNVGIGTSTPSSILSLGGTVARTIQMERNTTASTAGQGLIISSGGAIVGTTANLAGGDLTLKSGISTGTGTSAIRFLTATPGTSGSADRTPNEKMTILGNGNVGIGTTNPTRCKLQINNGDNTDAAILATSSAGNNLIVSSLNPTAQFSTVFKLSHEFFDSERNNGYISFHRGGNERGGFLEFGTDGSPRMWIDTYGKVGIGTTIPDALLTVNGTIHAKEVKIDLSGSFADYVFEKNYTLRPLNEVHSFIKVNGHLPEIPSAEEVNKNGIDVADMQVKLLKKIEELTLYAIEQQEKSIDQQKRIEALEKELRQVKNK